jgi:hypothetical protein
MYVKFPFKKMDLQIIGEIRLGVAAKAATTVVPTLQ